VILVADKEPRFFCCGSFCNLECTTQYSISTFLSYTDLESSRRNLTTLTSAELVTKCFIRRIVSRLKTGTDTLFSGFRACFARF
jgi:hypothetical protein